MRSASFWFATLLIGSAALLLGCEGLPTAPDSTPAQLEASLAYRTPPKPHRPKGSLLTCKPLPDVSVSKVIGPAGGQLVVGKHVLVIPRGALDARVKITAVAPSDTVNYIRFGPEGLDFNRPVRLTMSYANCNLGASTRWKRVAYTDDSLAILQYQPSRDHVVKDKVTGLLSHFSTYAVSW